MPGTERKNQEIPNQSDSTQFTSAPSEDHGELQRQRQLQRQR